MFLFSCVCLLRVCVCSVCVCLLCVSVCLCDLFLLTYSTPGPILWRASNYYMPCLLFSILFSCSRASVLETLLTALTRLVLQTATYRTEEKHADRHENIDAIKWRLEHRTEWG